jgi:DNA (cytosine-5)-methyltransferase 1
MIKHYYNEFDPYAAEWLRNLIAAGHLPAGDVDTRSIVDVRPADLAGYRQAHFFAGIGGWGLAARLAGWPDDRPLWTGSCPCQPFSVAGKGAGVDDPRHLWPHFFRLIAACRPPVVMGEQVAGAAGYGWLDGVVADLASEGYAGRGVDIPACAVDAPHIRSRLYWVAMADAPHGGRREERADAGRLLAGDRAQGWRAGSGAGNGDLRVAHPDSGVGGRRPDEPQRRLQGRDADRRTGAASLDHADDPRLEGYARHGDDRAGWQGKARSVASTGGGDVADAEGERQQRGQRSGNGEDQGGQADGDIDGQLAARIDGDSRGRNGTFWSDHAWLTGADGKARRAQPGLPLLAHGIPNRVGRLRAYGNAIVPQLAAEVIAAFMEARP